MTSMETSRLLHQVRAGEQMVAKRVQERKSLWEKVRVALTTLDDCGDKQGPRGWARQLPQGLLIVAGRDLAES